MVAQVSGHLTSSTRPNPPTPKVSMMLKSASFRLEKKAFSASYLHFLKWKKGNFLEVWIEYWTGNVSKAGTEAGKLLIRPLAFRSRTWTGRRSRILTFSWSSQKIKWYRTVQWIPLKRQSNSATPKLTDLPRRKRLILQFMRRFGRVFATARAQMLS